MLKNIGLTSSNGKMAKEIININNIHQYFNLKTKSKNYSIEQLCKNNKLVIDFSSTSLLEDLLKYSTFYNTKLVIGTTGYNQKQVEKIYKASKKIPILYSPNMSTGINLISKLLENYSKIISDLYDISILDIHHKNKVDQPSGTSLFLKDQIIKNLPKDKNSINKIDNISIKGGNIPGIHDIHLMGNNEIITISHKALNRSIFAEGAIKAALWLYSQNKPNLYSMKDILE